MDELLEFAARLDFLDYIVLLINLPLFFFARRILLLIYHDPDSTSGFNRKVMVFRALNILIVIAFGYYHIVLPLSEKAPWFKVVTILVTVYLGYVALHLIHYFTLKRYGKLRTRDGERKPTETYATRLLGIFSTVFIAIMALITIIRILGYTSLLEAGGVIGFIGVFLALTQSTWAPDMFSGLIILNSDMMEEGDVIELRDGEHIYGVVYKTKVFHTVILNLVNNHRIMIRNARLREFTVHNLSKFASAKGLREKMSFKIGYQTGPSKVKELFDRAFDLAVMEGLPVEVQHGYDSGITDTGDHAVEWAVFYYTKEVDRLPWLRQQMRAVYLKTAQERAISLATPLTHIVTLENSESRL